MINRQRKRAYNVIRCLKKQYIIKLIKNENEMLNQLNYHLQFVENPSFVYYQDGKMMVSDELTKNQMIQIELDSMIEDSQQGKLNHHYFNSRLAVLLGNLDKVNQEN
jgi:hypothetical protein